MATIIIKSGTTSIQGATVKGSFSYFSGSTIELGPTSSTGFYSGIDAPEGGYTVYTTGGPSGFNITLASDTTQLNTRLISLGAPYGTVNDNITWASSNNAIYINSGATLSSYYYGGGFTTVGGVSTNRFTKYFSNGTSDPSYDIGSGFNGEPQGIAIDSNNKAIVGGNYTTFNGSSQNKLIRLNTNGSKDTSFDIGSGFAIGQYPSTIAIDSNGKILVGGLFTTYNGSSQNYLIRLNTDGSKDTSFNIGSGFNGQVTSIAIDSNGKIVVGGSFTLFTGATANYIIRLNSDGSVDTSFNVGTGFNSAVASLAIDSNNKVVVGGAFSSYNGVFSLILIRINSDGSKDTSYPSGGGNPNSNVYKVTIDSNGKIYVGGAFTAYNGVTSNRIVRLNSDGSRDSTFAIGTGFDNQVNAISVKSDGRVLVGGFFSSYSSTGSPYGIVLNSNGSINSTTPTFNNFILTTAIK
jgi:uncharacterized delta-60 repeat protein